MTTETGVVFSKPLTLGAVAQVANQDLYVATKVFPIVLANSLKGTYKYFNIADLNTFAVEVRKPGASYKNVTLNVSEQAYLCKQYGLKYSLPIEHENELGGDILQTGANFLYDQGLKTLEYQLASTYLVTGLWGTDYAPTNKWSGTGNPITDIRNAQVSVRKAGQGIADCALMTEDVFLALLENAIIIDRLSVDTLRVLTQAEQLANILGLKEIHILRQTTLTGFCLLYVKNPTAPEQNPNAGLIIIRNYAEDVMDAKGIGITNPYFDEDTDSKVLKLKLRFAMVVPAPNLGYLFNTVV